MPEKALCTIHPLPEEEGEFSLRLVNLVLAENHSEITEMRLVNLLSVQALVIEIILILAGLLVLTPSKRSHKACTADRTFDKPR